MCGLFGFVDYGHTLSMKQKNRLLSALATASEVRGKDATGIAYNAAGSLHTYKLPVPGRWMRFKVPSEACVVMGHTRAATQGSAKKNRNNHPFVGQAGGQAFALSHNGVLFNDYDLRKEFGLPRTKIETDSYVAVQLLERKGSLTMDNLRSVAEQVRGSFTFCILDNQDALHVIIGDSPFKLMHFPKRKLYIYASTGEILQQALERVRLTGGVEIPVDSGEILKLTPDGSILRDRFDDSALMVGPLYNWRRWYEPYNWSGSYMDDLYSVASSFGYTPDNIDSLLRQGFTTDEIEDLLYDGEM